MQDSVHKRYYESFEDFNIGRTYVIWPVLSNFKRNYPGVCKLVSLAGPINSHASESPAKATSLIKYSV